MNRRQIAARLDVYPGDVVTRTAGERSGHLPPSGFVADWSDGRTVELLVSVNGGSEFRRAVVPVPAFVRHYRITEPNDATRNGWDEGARARELFALRGRGEMN